MGTLSISLATPVVLTTTSTATTASFTPTAGATLIVMAGGASSGANAVTTTITDSIGGATWTNKIQANHSQNSSSGALAAIVTRSPTVSGSSMTVTATNSGTSINYTAIIVFQVTGGALQFGATGNGSGSTQSITPTIFTSTVTNSTAFVCATEWSGGATVISSDLTISTGSNAKSESAAGYKTLSSTGSQTANYQLTASGFGNIWVWAAIELYTAAADVTSTITETNSVTAAATAGNVTSTITATNTVTANVTSTTTVSATETATNTITANTNSPAAVASTITAINTVTANKTDHPNVTSTITATSTVTAGGSVNASITATSTVTANVTSPANVTSTITATNVPFAYTISLGSGSLITATSSIATFVTYPTTDGISATNANGFLGVLQNTTYAGIANVYVQLHTGSPGPIGTNNLSAVTTRNLITWNPPSGGSMTFIVVPLYVMTTTETITDVSLWTDPSTGVYLWSSPISPRLPVINGSVIYFTSFTVNILTIAS